MIYEVVAESCDLFIRCVVASRTCLVCVPTDLGAGRLFCLVIYEVVAESSYLFIRCVIASRTCLVCVPTDLRASRLLSFVIYEVMAESRNFLGVGVAADGAHEGLQTLFCAGCGGIYCLNVIVSLNRYGCGCDRCLVIDKADELVAYVVVDVSFLDRDSADLIVACRLGSGHGEENEFALACKRVQTVCKTEYVCELLARNVEVYARLIKESRSGLGADLFSGELVGSGEDLRLRSYADRESLIPVNQESDCVNAVSRIDKVDRVKIACFRMDRRADYFVAERAVCVKRDVVRIAASAGIREFTVFSRLGSNERGDLIIVNVDRNRCAVICKRVVDEADERIIGVIERNGSIFNVDDINAERSFSIDCFEREVEDRAVAVTDVGVRRVDNDESEVLACRCDVEVVLIVDSCDSRVILSGVDQLVIRCEDVVRKRDAGERESFVISNEESEAVNTVNRVLDVYGNCDRFAAKYGLVVDRDSEFTVCREINVVCVGAARASVCDLTVGGSRGSRERSACVRVNVNCDRCVIVSVRIVDESEEFAFRIIESYGSVFDVDDLDCVIACSSGSREREVRDSAVAGAYCEVCSVNKNESEVLACGIDRDTRLVCDSSNFCIACRIKDKLVGSCEHVVCKSDVVQRETFVISDEESEGVNTVWRVCKRNGNSYVFTAENGCVVDRDRERAVCGKINVVSVVAVNAGVCDLTCRRGCRDHDCRYFVRMYVRYFVRNRLFLECVATRAFSSAYTVFRGCRLGLYEPIAPIVSERRDNYAGLDDLLAEETLDVVGTGLRAGCGSHVDVLFVAVMKTCRLRTIRQCELTVAGDNVDELSAIGLLVIEVLMESGSVDLDRDHVKIVRVEALVILESIASYDTVAFEVDADVNVIVFIVAPFLLRSLTVENGAGGSPRAVRTELRCGVETDLGEEVGKDFIHFGLFIALLEIGTLDSRASCKVRHSQALRINGDDLHLRKSIRVVRDGNIHSDACPGADVESRVFHPDVQRVIRRVRSFRSCGDRKRRNDQRNHHQRDYHE